MIPCAVMRGGTTRGFFFQTKDLPRDPAVRDEVLLSVVAGIDSWQADGLGGNDLLLSKVALVSHSKRSGIDLDVIFGAITPGSARIKYGSNCGNLISAAGLYAFDEGWADENDGPVRIFNPDSNGVVEARLMHTPAWFSGMPSTGTAMEIAFIEPDGTIGRGLLPTGNVIDNLFLEDGRKVEVSIVDSGTVYVFASMNDFAENELLQAGEYLRGQVAVMIGLAESAADVPRVTPNVPKVAFVSPPRNSAEEDVVARIVSSQSLHNAYAVTGAFATIACAAVAGSIVSRVMGSTAVRSPFTLRIRHPRGVIEPRIDFRSTATSIAVERAYIIRTARRLMRGVTYPVTCSEVCTSSNSSRVQIHPDPLLFSLPQDRDM